MIKHYPDLIQGSDEWKAARCGLLTASEMKLILTSTMRPSNNDKQRAHVFEILAQRITGHVESSYVSDDMLRGIDEEIEARAKYHKHYAPVTEAGFITNDEWGFTLGYSPDGLVGDDGLIECKSRRQKYQVQAIIENEVPSEHVTQLQTGLLVSGRKWIDYLSYCGGLPMFVIRAYPDPKIQEAIIQAATEFEKTVQELLARYNQRKILYLNTERKTEQEIIL